MKKPALTIGDNIDLKADEINVTDIAIKENDCSFDEVILDEFVITEPTEGEIKLNPRKLKNEDGDEDGDEGGGENRARGDVAAVSRGARGAARRVRGAQGEQREARERGRGAAQGAERVRAAVTM